MIKEILQSLHINFPKLISPIYPFPKPFLGKGKIKAIDLVADPTNIINNEPKLLKQHNS